MLPHNTSDEKLLSIIDKARAKSLDDFFFFCKHVLEIENKGALAPVHKELCDFYANEQVRKKVVLFPRGHLKSTIGEAYILWRLARNPNETILIISATTDMARKFLRNIKWHFMYNLMFRDYYFPNLIPEHLKIDLKSKKSKAKGDDDKWGEYEIVIAGRGDDSPERDSSVSVSGMEKNVTGSHPSIILFDDPINEQWVDSFQMREKAKSQVQLALSLLKPGGTLLFNGTYYSDQDLYCWLETLDLFDVFKRSAYYTKDDGTFEVIYPTKFVMTDAEIEKDEFGVPKQESFETLRRIQGEAHFARQYMLQPIAEKDRLFRSGDLRYYDGEIVDGKIMVDLYYMNVDGELVPLPREEHAYEGSVADTVLAIDTAYSEEKSADETGIACGSFTYDNRMFLHEVVGMKTESNQLILMQAYEMKVKHKVKRVGAESLGFKWLEDAAIMFANDVGDRSFAIMEKLEPRGVRGELKKKVRIKNLQHWTETKRLYLPLMRNAKGKLTPEPWVHKFISQMLDFTMTATGRDQDDLLDAAAYLPRMYDNVSVKNRYESKVRRNQQRRDVYCAITGY